MVACYGVLPDIMLPFGLLSNLKPRCGQKGATMAKYIVPEMEINANDFYRITTVRKWDRCRRIFADTSSEKFPAKHGCEEYIHFRTTEVNGPIKCNSLHLDAAFNFCKNITVRRLRSINFYPNIIVLRTPAIEYTLELQQPVDRKSVALDGNYKLVSANTEENKRYETFIGKKVTFEPSMAQPGHPITMSVKGRGKIGFVVSSIDEQEAVILLHIGENLLVVKKE